MVSQVAEAEAAANPFALFRVCVSGRTAITSNSLLKNSFRLSFRRARRRLPEQLHIPALQCQKMPAARSFYLTSSQLVRRPAYLWNALGSLEQGPLSSR